MGISNGVKKIFLGFFIIILFFAVFNNIWAAGLVPCGRTDPGATAGEREPCQFCHLFVMLDRIIDFLLFQIVPPLAALMIAIGGGMYIIGRGSPEMHSRAKSLFTAVVYGLLIIYGAFLFIGLFLKIIGLADWTTDIYQNWWREGLFEIPCP